MESKQFEPRVPLTGESRIVARRIAAELYAAGLSIRSVAFAINRSYGFTRNILEEAGVNFRKRGGDRVSKAYQRHLREVRTQTEL